MNKRLVVLLGVLLAIVLGTMGFAYNKRQKPEINDFKSCGAHYPIQESYPEVCKTPDGKSFTNPDQQVVVPPSGHGGQCDDPNYYEKNIENCKFQ